MNPLVLSILVLSMPSLAKEENRPVPSVMVFRDYPKLAAAAKDSGSVVLTYGVDRDGNVVNVRLRSGNQRLFKYSKWLFEKWKFIPDGRCVDKDFELTFNFELSDKKDDDAESRWISPDCVLVKGKPISIKDNQSGY